MRSKKLLLGAKHRRTPAKSGCVVFLAGVVAGNGLIAWALWEVISRG